MTPEPVGSTHLRFDDARVIGKVCTRLPNVVRSHEEFRNGPKVKIDIYEVWFWPPEVFRASPVVYRDHRRGPGGTPGGATSPGGLHGPIVGRDQPLGGLGRLPPRPKAPSRGEGANPRGRWALRPTLGAPPSLSPLAASQMGSRGCRHP